MNENKLLEQSVTILRAALKRLTPLECGVLIISRLKDKTKFQLQQGGSDIYEEQADPAVYECLSNYLNDLSDPQITELFGVTATPRSEGNFRFLLNFGKETISYMVRQSDMRLSISDPIKYRKDTLIEALPLSQLRKSQVINLTSRPQGIVIIAAPNEKQEKLSRAFWSALSEAIPLYDLSSVAEASGTAFVTLQAIDPLDPLFMLKEVNNNPSKLSINASMAFSFLPKNCAACSRVSTPDQRSLKGLPYPLPDGFFDNYQIGRGCTRCNEKGYAGVVCLASAIDKGVKEILTKIEAGAKDTEILDLVYDHGAIALFEDGLEKIKTGVLSFESLLKVVNTVPEAYLKRHQGTVNTVKNEPTYHERREKPLLLVAEDDPDQASILELVLTSAGYDTVITRNGREAFAVAKGRLPDLILTDLMMPEMDGSALVKAVREDKDLEKTPILILTVSTDKEKEFQLLDIGADDYCEKTVQRKVLLKRVEKLLRLSWV